MNNGLKSFGHAIAQLFIQQIGGLEEVLQPVIVDFFNMS